MAHATWKRILPSTKKFFGRLYLFAFIMFIVTLLWCNVKWLQLKIFDKHLLYVFRQKVKAVKFACDICVVYKEWAWNQSTTYVWVSRLEIWQLWSQGRVTLLSADCLRWRAVESTYSSKFASHIQEIRGVPWL